MQIDTGDTAWVLMCVALVLLMTPGLAFFYAGMVRSKHVLNMLMQNFICLAVVSVTWTVVGYALAFGADLDAGLAGDLRFVGLSHSAEAVPGFESLTIPPLAFMAFQLMFAIVTTALLSGAVADRMRFSAFVVLTAIWSVIVYAPLAHWSFSPSGWLFKLGLLDFAGGTVVEVCSGASALALAIVLGRRRGWPQEAMPPHNLPLTMLGAGLLWFGWLGFNAGSALAANSLAAHALVSTHLAGVGGIVGWLVLERRLVGVATTLGGASGAVAGLVAITPAAGYVEPLPALLLGMLAGGICLFGVRMKFRFKYDDSLDVVGVHFVGGVVGTLFVGVFATSAVNAAVTNEGLFYGGGFQQLTIQALGVVAAACWAFGMTFALAWILNKTMGLRVLPEHEVQGLDYTQHAENAYELGTSSGMGRLGG